MRIGDIGLDVVVHACSTREAEAGVLSGVQGHPGISSKFGLAWATVQGPSSKIKRAKV